MNAARFGMGAICLGVALLSGLIVHGQESPKSPRVNTAITYEVDAKWPARPAEFTWGAVPGIAVDAKDNVYVFTRSKPPVQVYSAEGKYLRGWGEKSIARAHHIRIDHKGNVWTSDIDDHVVQKYTPEGELLMTLGVKGKAGRDDKHFNKPTDMAITPEGDIFISDGYGNSRVVHFDKSGKFINAWGELGPLPGQFDTPHSIAVDAKGILYVADRNNARIQLFDQKGKFLAEWKNLIIPWGLYVTPKNEIWACGSSPMQWRKQDTSLGCPPKDQIFIKFTPDGRILQLFTVPKGLDGLERPGELNWVHAMAIDSRGNLYAGDIIGKRAQKFSVRMP